MTQTVANQSTDTGRELKHAKVRGFVTRDVSFVQLIALSFCGILLYVEYRAISDIREWVISIAFRVGTILISVQL